MTCIVLIKVRESLFKGKSLAQNYIQQTSSFYIGNFEVEPAANMIAYRGETVALEPQAVLVLQCLSGYGDNVAPRGKILDMAWSNNNATDEGLTRAIYLLRKAFKRLGAITDVIKTAHKRGYYLTLPVTFPASNIQLTQKASTGDLPTIAVLAFTDISPGSNFEHIGDGISEEILNALTRNAAFRVAARTSAFSFKGKNIDLAIIGKALNVRYVLEGSVRVTGQLLRVSGNLIDTHTGFIIVSERYERPFEDIFDIQDSIAQILSETLTKKLISPKKRPAGDLTKNTKAYELFLQGRALNQRIYGEDTLLTAKKFLKRAIALDPEFSQAYEELAHTYSLESTYDTTALNKREMIKTAADYARRAVALNPNLGFARTFIAIEMMTIGDLVGAIDFTKEAYLIDPNSAEVNLRLGFFYLMIGRVIQAIPFLETSVALDPIQGRNLQVLAIARLCNDEPETAEQLAKRSMDLHYLFAYDIHNAATFAQGKSELAVRRAARAPAEMQRTYKLEKPALWEFAAKACYGNDEKLIQPFTEMVIAMWGGDSVICGEKPPSILLLISLIRVGAAEELFRHVGNTPPPGSNSVLLNLWVAGEPYSKIYNHPDFMDFANSIGFAAAWQKFGMPDRLL